MSHIFDITLNVLQACNCRKFSPFNIQTGVATENHKRWCIAQTDIELIINCIFNCGQKCVTILLCGTQFK